METKCAPTYANIFMEMFEESYTYHLIQEKCKLYLKYIDDIFLIWTETLDELNKFIAKKHFEQHYYKTAVQVKRYRLVKKFKPVPTTFDPKESHLPVESKHLKSPVSVLGKSPTKRIYQQDQFKLFKKQEKIKKIFDTDSTLRTLGYTFQKYDDHVVFYHLETKG